MYEKYEQVACSLIFNVTECGSTGQMGKAEHCSIYPSIARDWASSQKTLFFILSFIVTHNLSFNNVRIRNFTFDNMNVMV